MLCYIGLFPTYLLFANLSGRQHPVTTNHSLSLETTSPTSPQAQPRQLRRPSHEAFAALLVADENTSPLAYLPTLRHFSSLTVAPPSTCLACDRLSKHFLSWPLVHGPLPLPPNILGVGWCPQILGWRPSFLFAFASRKHRLHRSSSL